jgi:hypothetical protein
MKGRVDPQRGWSVTRIAVSMAVMALIESAITPRAAVADDLRCSIFNVSVPGFVGQNALQLTIAATGNLTGTYFGDPIQGFYDNVSNEMIFIRQVKGSADPGQTQVYTGYYWPDASSNVDNLAGFFEAFAGSGASVPRHRYGWEAFCGIPG